MAKIAVLDWSYLTHVAWTSLPSHKTPWTRPSEAEEGIHRISEWVYALQVEHGWDRLIIATDTPGYWRAEYMADWFSLVPRYTHGGLYYCQHDGAWHRIDQVRDDAGQWGAQLVKLTADESKVLYSKPVKVKGCPKLDPQLLAEQLERWPETLAEPTWPRYKGNRKGEWACETSPKDFRDLRARLASRLARLVNGKVIGYSGAEADDIAAVVATFGTKHEILLISGDGDWATLCQHPGVSLHNIYSNSRTSHSPETVAEANRLWMIKVVGGDSGDNIKGVPYADGRGRGCIAKDGADKLVRSIDASEWPTKLYPQLHGRTFVRNTRLVSLDKESIPPHIWDGIQGELSKPEPSYSSEPWSWEKLGLTKVERERVEVHGGVNRIFAQWGGGVGGLV